MAQPPHNEPANRLVVVIETAIIGCIFLIAAVAPHSIAATQGAWLLGLFLWIIRLFIFPRPKFFSTPLDYALLGFFILSGVSGVFSYNPVMSIGKMRAASLFTIVYLVAQNVRSLRTAHLLAFTLIGSCVVNVFFTAGQFVIGKGVKIQGVKAESPLAKAIFETRTVHQPTPIVNGDTIWEVDGKRVDTPEEIASALASGSPEADVRIWRVEWTPVLKVPRARLLPGSDALEQLGISSWSSGRDWRATGFFNHWVTYAEVLQLIASLALGLLLGVKGWPRSPTPTKLLLGIAVVGLVFALGMTVTRASWIGFAVAAVVMLALSVSKRTLLIVGACALPLVLASIVVLQQKRAIGFFDRNDQSTSWRQTVWKEGVELLISKPRHLLVGVGIDSIKGYWRAWRLFDGGRLPVGHMHSNILQIAVERGVPALIAWLLLMGVYGWTLVKAARGPDVTNGYSKGIALGALGGLVGFFTSGLVHYNWGDSEVVTVFYFIMGLSLVVVTVERAGVQEKEVIH